MIAGPVWALDVPAVPLVTNASTQTPLNLLVLGKDHKLFYEAYDDASDLDGDGLVDTRYKPASIDYYGYFDSKKCYVYSNSNGRFDPVQTTANKQCNSGSNTAQWSGDFLNYLTTARIDALRRVLYGGSRYLDEAVSGKLGSGRLSLVARFGGRHLFWRLHRHDLPEHVAADGVVLPGAGVEGAVDDDARGEGAKARDRDVVERDHRRLPRPLHFHWHWHREIDAAVADPGRNDPQIGVADFRH